MGAFGVTEKPAERDELVGMFRSFGEEAEAEAAQARARAAKTRRPMRGRPGACRREGAHRRRRHPQHLLVDERS